MSKNRGSNKENLEKTRKTFIHIAAEEFTEHGYADASTSRIVQKSGMARGSLYYHFGDKQGLFAAVYEDILTQGSKSLEKSMREQETSALALLHGSYAFMDLCMDKTFRKIVLIESQSAIAYKDRLPLLEQTLFHLLMDILDKIIAEGHLEGNTDRTAAVLIAGMLNEIGKVFDFSDNIERDRAELGKAYESVLLRLFTTA